MKCKLLALLQRIEDRLAAFFNPKVEALSPIKLPAKISKKRRSRKGK